MCVFFYELIALSSQVLLVADHRAELAEQALQEMVLETKLCKAGLHTLQTSFNELKQEYERMRLQHKVLQEDIDSAQEKSAYVDDDEDAAETPRKQTHSLEQTPKKEASQDQVRFTKITHFKELKFLHYLGGASRGCPRCRCF